MPVLTAVPFFITLAASLVAAIIDVGVFRPWEDEHTRRSGMAFWVVQLVLAVSLLAGMLFSSGPEHSLWWTIGSWVEAAVMVSLATSMSVHAWRTR